MSQAPDDPATSHRHSPGFARLIEQTRARVQTMTIEQLLARRKAGEAFVLIDTREEHEWDAGHLPGALHLGKGIIERDIEKTVPDPATPIVTYCGGGYRSVLVCDNLQKMGYAHCISLDGGWREWSALGLPVVTPETGTEPA